MTCALLSDCSSLPELPVMTYSSGVSDEIIVIRFDSGGRLARSKNGLVIMQTFFDIIFFPLSVKMCLPPPNEIIMALSLASTSLKSYLGSLNNQEVDLL